MSADNDIVAATEIIVQRARDRLNKHVHATHVAADKVFVKLLLGQWAFAIFLALVVSPYAWQGKTKVVHLHVWIAVLLGGLLVSLPLILVRTKPGETVTRLVIAVAQMLFSALLIHLTGGRIETHFHVFGSLAFLAFYLDWLVLLTAVVTIAIDHFVRGLVWPESVYGIVNPEWWRFLEHAGWVIFCASCLIYACIDSRRQWLQFAEEGGMLEALAESEWRQKSVLERAGEKP